MIVISNLYSLASKYQSVSKIDLLLISVILPRWVWDEHDFWMELNLIESSYKPSDFQSTNEYLQSGFFMGVTTWYDIKMELHIVPLADISLSDCMFIWFCFDFLLVTGMSSIDSCWFYFKPYSWSIIPRFQIVFLYSHSQRKPKPFIAENPKRWANTPANGWLQNARKISWL